MPTPNFRFYEYAFELVKFYNTNPSFRASFPRLFDNPRVTYKGYKLKLYVRLLASLDHQYNEYTKTSLSPENTGELFEKFYKNTVAFQKLDKGIANQEILFPKEEHEELVKIDQLPTEEAKQKAQERFLGRKEQEEKSAENPTSTQAASTTSQPAQPTQNAQQTAQPVFTTQQTFTPTGPLQPSPLNASPTIPNRLISRFKIPLQAEAFIQRVATPSRLLSGLSSLAGGTIGYFATGTPIGTLAGAAMGGFAPSILKNGGFKALGKAGKGAVNVGGNLLEKALSTNPFGKVGVIAWKSKKIIIYGIIAFAALAVIIFSGFFDSAALFPPYQQIASVGTAEAGELVKITKTGPASIPDNNSNIDYKITVTYVGTGKANVDVTDQIPEQTDFVDAPASGDISAGTLTGTTVKWSLVNIIPNQQQILQLTIKPTINNIWVSNKATVNVVSISLPSTNPAPNGSGAPANNNNCQGKYDLKNPVGNFGDPNCNFNQNKLADLLKQIDPRNADYWFNTVARCESHYNPNAYGGHDAIGTPDVAGAWGLFQMGRGKNGQFDHGDVEWQLQTSNAVSYNNNLAKSGVAWRYWACAQSRW